MDGSELNNRDGKDFGRQKRKPDKEVQLRSTHTLFGYMVANYKEP